MGSDRGWGRSSGSWQGCELTFLSGLPHLCVWDFGLYLGFECWPVCWDTWSRRALGALKATETCPVMPLDVPGSAFRLALLGRQGGTWVPLERAGVCFQLPLLLPTVS